MASDLENQARPERQRIINRARALVKSIEQSRRDFQREIQSRRKLLATIQEDTKQRAKPPDPLIEDIERQWQRLYADYRAYRRQHDYPAPGQLRKGRAEP